MKLNPKKDIRDLARFNQIMLVLAQQGLGHIFDKLKIKKRHNGKKIIEKEQPERLRKSFEKLGPTFIKLGQVLSLRPDLVPKEYIEELGKLQDKVPPFPYAKVEEIIKKELKKPIEKIFKNFSKGSIASASMAQVHKATLKNGNIVAVKVQRPDINEMMKIDIEIMSYVAKLLTKHSKKIARYNPIAIVKEFKNWTEKELDFRLEAKNAKRFYKNFKDSKTVKIPKVFDYYSTKKVLTLEFIDGIELHNISKLKGRKGHSLKEIVKNGFDSIMTQVFIHGFFHADPHPGNIFVLKGNKIALVDFGIVGSFDNKLKQKSIELFYGIIEEDVGAIVDVFLDMGLINEKKTDVESFKEDVLKVVVPLQKNSLKNIKVSYVLEEVLDIALKHHVKMPIDFVLFGKTIVELEGVALEYAPRFKLVENSRPFIEKLIKKNINISNMAKDLIKNLAKYRKLFKELPDQLSSTLRKIQKGTVKVDIEDTDVKRLANDIDKSSNRMTYGLLIAAFLVTGALLVDAGEPVFYGLPLFSLLFFLAAFILALTLILIGISYSIYINKK